MPLGDNKQIIDNQEKEQKALNLRRRKFIKHYIETGNQTEAARRAGYKHPVSMGSWLMSLDEMKSAFRMLMDAAGVTDAKLIEVGKGGLEANKVISANIVQIKSDDPTVEEKEAHTKTQDFIEVPDWNARHKFWKTFCQMRGHVDTRHEDQGAGTTTQVTQVMLPQAMAVMIGINGQVVPQ